jgi:hypothetical protein
MATDHCVADVDDLACVGIIALRNSILRTFGIVGTHDVADVTAEHILGRIAEQLLARRFKAEAFETTSAFTAVSSTLAHRSPDTVVAGVSWWIVILLN